MSNTVILFNWENSKTNPLFENGKIIEELREIEAEEDEEIKECRICLESSGELISVCNCNGSMKYVHKNCIEQWITQTSNTHCEICKQPYNVDLITVLSEEKRRCNNSMLLTLYLMYLTMTIILIILFVTYL